MRHAVTPCAMRHACHVNASIRAYRACAADVRVDDGAHRAAAPAAVAAAAQRIGAQATATARTTRL
ncbi:hypothetical protein BVV20_18670 [Xanthomonas oryzae pv. oryzae]|nr:hypothetical protein BVV20_18670 [Xanthomonas oryzae pv. oryzae]